MMPMEIIPFFPLTLRGRLKEGDLTLRGRFRERALILRGMKTLIWYNAG